MILSTLCYLIKDKKVLMLLRNKKKKDVNEGKWIGVGGKFLPAESPEECVARETLEETGLTIDSMRLRGVLMFSSEGWEDECIFVFTSDAFHGTMQECDEGRLQWIPFDEVDGLSLWEGDRLFMRPLLFGDRFFSMKLQYQGDSLIKHEEHFY